MYLSDTTNVNVGLKGYTLVLGQVAAAGAAGAGGGMIYSKNKYHRVAIVTATNTSM